MGEYGLRFSKKLGANFSHKPSNQESKTQARQY